MWIQRLMIVGLVMLVSACSTTRTPVGVPVNGASTRIQAGDRVDVNTSDGRFYEFVVQDVRNTGLAGDTIFIPYQDMVSVAVLSQQPNWKAIGWGAAIAATVLVLAAAASQDEPESDGWGWSCSDWAWLYACPN